MGSKLRPGAFDCYANALPDEPMFILLARDRSAPAMLRAWADRRRTEVLAADGQSDALEDELRKCSEADGCADEMTLWRKRRDGDWREGATPRRVLAEASDEERAAIEGAVIRVFAESCSIPPQFQAGAFEIVSHQARSWSSPLFSARRHSLLVTSQRFESLSSAVATDAARYEIQGMTIGDVEIGQHAADRLVIELMAIVDL